MDEKTAWDMYFAGIASIRFHPRNDKPDDTIAEKVENAAKIADHMVIQRRKRWHG